MTTNEKITLYFGDLSFAIDSSEIPRFVAGLNGAARIESPVNNPDSEVTDLEGNPAPHFAARLPVANTQEELNEFEEEMQENKEAKQSILNLENAGKEARKAIAQLHANADTPLEIPAEQRKTASEITYIEAAHVWDLAQQYMRTDPDNPDANVSAIALKFNMHENLVSRILRGVDFSDLHDVYPRIVIPGSPTHSKKAYDALKDTRTNEEKKAYYKPGDREKIVDIIKRYSTLSPEEILQFVQVDFPRTKINTIRRAMALTKGGPAWDDARRAKGLPVFVEENQDVRRIQQ